MKKKDRLLPYFWAAALSAGLLLPSLTLIPFGSLWLWQHGYILPWALVTASLVAIAFAVQHRLLKSAAPPPGPREPAAVSSTAEALDPSWTPAETQAWSDVLDIARRLDVSGLDSRDAILGLGALTVRAVAKRLHPEVKEPLWQFTVPEAFAIIERVSRRLGTFTADTIPLSDRLTVAQALALYEWRGAVDYAEKAYDVWRLVRMTNPLTAATQELRDRLSRQMIHWGRTHVTQRLGHAYVTEVGRAAIDLYGGRLRVSQHQLETEMSAASRADKAELETQTVEPLRILLAGQTGAGKSSLINAMASEVRAAVDALPATSQFQAHELRRSGFPAAYLIDSPGIGPSEADRKALVGEALDADLVLWVVPAHRADRDIVRLAIKELRQTFASLPNRRHPPILLVMTQIDRLRPFQDWSPPYDLAAADQPKAVSIRAALETVARELEFADSDVIAVSLRAGAMTNIDGLWERIVAVLPEARRAQLMRRLVDARSSWNWRRVWRQTTGAGRLIGRSLGK